MDNVLERANVNGLSPSSVVQDVAKTQCVGLNKRELFAIACLQGLLSNANSYMLNMETHALAYTALKYADALLIELENSK